MNAEEYYETLTEVTANGDCERCAYGCGCCHLQCNETFEEYEKKERRGTILEAVR